MEIKKEKYLFFIFFKFHKWTVGALSWAFVREPDGGTLNIYLHLREPWWHWEMIAFFLFSLYSSLIAFFSHVRHGG